MIFVLGTTRLLGMPKVSHGGEQHGLGAMFGNAAMSRNRWVHHTSWLWAFDERNMELLTLPPKRPDYRGDRSHSDFLRPISSLWEGAPDSSLEFEARLLCQALSPFVPCARDGSPLFPDSIVSEERCLEMLQVARDPTENPWLASLLQETIEDAERIHEESVERKTTTMLSETELNRG